MANDLSLYDAANWWCQKDGFYLLSKMNPGRFSYFCRYIADWKDLAVLDVGCGGGFTCEFMAKLHANVSGVDSSESSIAQAQAHAEAQNLKINYQCGSALHLPYPDNSFDVVTCVDVLEHIPDWGRAVAQIHRVLKPGGHFFFDTINRNALSALVLIYIFEYVLRLIPRGTHDARLFIKPAELRAKLALTGFAAIHMTGFLVLWLSWKLDLLFFVGGPKTLLYVGHCVKAKD